jgi:ABC-type Mn2+/Zn2+ transport system permease subunit
MSNGWLHLFYAPDMLRPLFAAVLIGFTNGVLSVFIVYAGGRRFSGGAFSRVRHPDYRQ